MWFFRAFGHMGSAFRVLSSLFTLLGALAAGLLVAYALGFNPIMWFLTVMMEIAEWLIRGVFF